MSFSHALRLAVGSGIVVAALGIARPAAAAEAAAVTLESLLKEMVDYESVARWPDPPYTCRQASSYDRRSKTPSDPAGWFANTDNMDGLGADLKWEERQGRREAVMMDVDGPGAVVRFWSGGQKPKGKIRFYLDGAEQPAIEAPMYELLGGTGFVPKPLAITNAGDAINLYLPVPYARRCKITYDEGQPGKPNAPPPGRWFNIEYRTYPPGTKVKTFTMADFESVKETVGRVAQVLSQPPDVVGCKETFIDQALEGGQEASVDLPAGPATVSSLEVRLAAGGPEPPEMVLRSTIVRMAFDGELAVWCPAGDFFGSGVGLSALASWYRTVSKDGLLASRWVMPYEKSARVTLANVGRQKVAARLKAITGDWKWDSRSMHFHANWRQERSIPTRPYKDWNYITITGKGMYMGDTLALFNPVNAWWGEGDEKIWVDGESFPSHFGTGSEDYYGYAWGNPTPFQGPFANQVRVDGPGNQGHTTNTRTRVLDAIPFTKSLQTDIEIWHWADCKVNYAVTAYWYALPGATSNVKPSPEEAAAPIPESPGLARRAKIAGAIECEKMEIVAKSPNVAVETQDVNALQFGPWSEGKQLFVRGKGQGDFIELRFPAAEPGPKKVTLYGTTSWDYGILRFSINGKRVEKDFDAYTKESRASGPIELGVFEPKDGQMVLRVEVVGANPASRGTKAYFGLDCVVLSKP